MNRKKQPLSVRGLILFLVLFHSFTFVGCSEDAKVQEEESWTLRVPVSTAIYMDAYRVHRTLEVLHYMNQNGTLDQIKMESALKRVMAKMHQVERYMDNLDMIHTVHRARTYGAVAEKDRPIGGGNGYGEHITQGDYEVTDLPGLIEAVEQAKKGETIFIRGDAQIDLTCMQLAENYTIVVPEGVTLASDRGYEGSSGATLYSTALRSRPMIIANGDVRITGMTIRGADPHQRSYRVPLRAVGIHIDGDRVLVDNCVISGFSHAGIEAVSGEDHQIRCNFIHHNRTQGAGYGVSVQSANVCVSYNLFLHNNISIYGRGDERCVVKAEHNLDMGETHLHFIQMDILRQGRDMYTGESLIVRNNTTFHTRSPIVVNKLPAEKIVLENNLFGVAYEDVEKTDLYGEDLRYKDQIDYSSNLFDWIVKLHDHDEHPDYFEMHTANMNTTVVTSRIFHCDMHRIFEKIKKLVQAMEDHQLEAAFIESSLLEIIKAIEQYDRAYDYLENPNMEIDGEIFGVIPDENPLGGGYGYHDVMTTGDYIVSTKEDLIKALQKAKQGEVVFVKGDSVIDMTGTMGTVIPNGVTLASDRGHQNAPGALIFTDTLSYPLFYVQSDVRITGIVIRGADLEKRIDHHTRSFRVPNAPGSEYYYRVPFTRGITTRGSRLTVDNCEIAGFSHAAIQLVGGDGHHIHHNYIHHNQRQGLGYGVTHGTAYSIVEYNLLNFNRHDIAATGAPGSGYIARHNIQMGEALSSVFDVHGGADRGDGTNIAGELILMYHNLFLPDAPPYLIRGVPTEIQDFYNNIVYRPVDEYDVGRLYGRNDEEREKFSIRNNIFNLRDNPTLIP